MTEIRVRPKAPAAIAQDGLRPVNMRTDLRPLADLIELVFADSMDSSGRSAIREMRYLSHMGYGLNLISRLNDLALGISLGFVFILDGQLVGNVSVYPAGYPKDMSETWILANVAVHPAYQRRGIAGQLVDASLKMIRQRNGKRVILQVNQDNIAALRLYERQGFLYERTWRHWRRSGFASEPVCEGHEFHITRPGYSEWKSEYQLAQEARPNSSGGLGWLKPTHESSFRIGPWKRLINLFSLNGIEKLVIRDQANWAILAVCWLESFMSFSDMRLRFFASPRLDYSPHAAALFCNVLSRFPRSAISIEHPCDDGIVNELLKRYQFKITRELWHMRLDL